MDEGDFTLLAIVFLLLTAAGGAVAAVRRVLAHIDFEEQSFN
jgi:hypothetical protein